MESCFRIALGILLLTAYLLSAQPIKCRLIGQCEDPGLSLLRELQCGNMTFTSPTDVQSGCYVQALQHYVAGLNNSLTHCADINPMGKFYIKRVVRTLSSALQKTETNCNFTMTTHQSFQQFVNAIDKFIPEFNQHRR